LITHNPVKAYTMAETIIVYSQGGIEQIGTPKEIFSKPISKDVAMRMFVINEDVSLPEKSFDYIFFMKIAHNTASSMDREMKLSDGEYDTAIISESPRSSVLEGYVITNRDIGKGEQVNVYLFS
jgi:ABC-type Fe3+/spermidine/putrescine transport system ATPase subunit